MTYQNVLLVRLAAIVLSIPRPPKCTGLDLSSVQTKLRETFTASATEKSLRIVYIATAHSAQVLNTARKKHVRSSHGKHRGVTKEE